jgi:hypothetical protein
MWDASLLVNRYILLVVGQHLRVWCPHHIMDFVDLVHLVLALKERFKYDDFVEHTSKAPNVDLAIVETVR